MNVSVRRVKAWDADGAPTVWGFFNTPTKLKAIFNEVNKLTESKFTKEHGGKFYFNGIGGFWYTKDKSSVELAKQKIEEAYEDIRVNISWNIF